MTSKKSIMILGVSANLILEEKFIFGLVSPFVNISGNESFRSRLFHQAVGRNINVFLR